MSFQCSGLRTIAVLTSGGLCGKAVYLLGGPPRTLSGRFWNVFPACAPIQKPSTGVHGRPKPVTKPNHSNRCSKSQCSPAPQTQPLRLVLQNKKAQQSRYRPDLLLVVVGPSQIHPDPVLLSCGKTTRRSCLSTSRSNPQESTPLTCSIIGSLPPFTKNLQHSVKKKRTGLLG
jgi:hypothetical protein